MRKYDMKRVISREFIINHAMAGEIIDVVMNQIANALIRDGRIELRGFGSFFLVRQKAMRRWDCYRKIVVGAAAKNVVKFRPGKKLRKAAITRQELPSPLAR